MVFYNHLTKTGSAASKIISSQGLFVIWEVYCLTKGQWYIHFLSRYVHTRKV